MNAKGKAAGYGQLAANVKAAVEKHGASATITGLTGVKVQARHGLN